METYGQVNRLVNKYAGLRDRQYAVYDRCAKLHDLTVNELFVLDILWFAEEGCTQKEICERLSANKQTISAVVGRFLKKGYIFFEEVGEDRRNKRIFFTENGKNYAGTIIPPAADAENLSMAELGLKNIAELVRLTEQFTRNMEKNFAKLTEVRE